MIFGFYAIVHSAEVKRRRAKRRVWEGPIRHLSGGTEPKAPFPDEYFPQLKLAQPYLIRGVGAPKRGLGGKTARERGHAECTHLLKK